MAATNSPLKPPSAPAVKTAKLFKNGRSQAVRLPKEFRFEGDEVAIRRDPATGNVILTPSAEARKNLSWTELFAVWDSLGTADMDFERQVSNPVERDLF
jgi:antitoxin VapB